MLALSFFEAEVEPTDFHVQRHAELLLDMGRADKAEALLNAHRQLELELLDPSADGTGPSRAG